MKLNLHIVATAEQGLFDVRTVGGSNLFTREEADEILLRVNGEQDFRKDSVIREAREMRDEMARPISGESLMALVETYRFHFNGLDAALNTLDGVGE